MVGNDKLDIDLFKTWTFSENMKNYVVSEREVQIRYEDEIVKIEAVNNIVNEYDEDERSKIPYENPKILMFSFSDKEIAMKILGDERLPIGLFIDDFKHIRSIEEFRATL